MAKHSIGPYRKSLLMAAVIGCCGVAGCSLFQKAPAPPPVAKVVVPPPKPELPKPSATHRFEIEPGGGDIVGYVQRTIVGKEDTLPDIARRFDVGYEEV